MAKGLIGRKGLAVGIILLFVASGILSSNAQNTEKTLPSSRGNWLYVGGNGPGNYTKIQDAINDTVDGDTVFVFHGTYYENIMIGKSILLTGENPKTTIINGSQVGTVIETQKSSVHISNFTVGGSGLSAWDQAIYVSFAKDFHLAYCIITGNVGGIRLKYVTDSKIEQCEIKNNSWCSMVIFTVKNLTISNCTIQNNGSPGGHGGQIDISNQEWYDWDSDIKIQYCTFSNNYFSSIHLGSHIKDIEISHNNISYHNYGISVWGTHFLQTFHKIIIKDNSILDNVIGIYLQDCKFGVLIEQNNISTNTEKGIYLLRASYMIIQNNNFIGNMIQTSFSNSLYNKWSQNYWDDWAGSNPYKISGSLMLKIPWFQFDRSPVQEPYDN